MRGTGGAICYPRQVPAVDVRVRLFASTLGSVSACLSETCSPDPLLQVHFRYHEGTGVQWKGGEATLSPDSQMSSACLRCKNVL